jgi:hypothetical protein
MVFGLPNSSRICSARRRIVQRAGVDRDRERADSHGAAVDVDCARLGAYAHGALGCRRSGQPARQKQEVLRAARQVKPDQISTE